MLALYFENQSQCSIKIYFSVYRGSIFLSICNTNPLYLQLNTLYQSIGLDKNVLRQFISHELRHLEILKATIFYIFHSCSCSEINIGYNICCKDNYMVLLMLYGVKYSSFVLPNLLFSILHPAPALCPLPRVSLDLTNDKYWKEQKRERAFFLSFLGHRLLVIALLCLRPQFLTGGSLP